MDVTGGQVIVEGAVIGNYQVVRKLGEGGMGAVYLGHHTLLGRRAAIKVLLPMLSARPDIVNRFFNEARATTSISDPGIVQIFDFGYHTDGSAFIVMEYLEGEPLDVRLAKLGRLPVSDALRLCRQVATSLAAAHAQRIVHRDLKPENIYLVRDLEMANGERAKILDFGIAKLSDDHPGKLKTSTGALMGTPIYMSPEQCHGASELDHRSDIYALGCVLFHLVVGTPPFDGDGMGEIIAAHLREEPPAPSSRCPGVAPGVDALVLRCLAKSPADRYQTMTELSRALGQLVGHITSPESATVIAPHRRPTPVPAAPLTQLANPTTLGSGAGEASEPPRAPRRLGVVVGAVLIVAAAAVATIVVLHRDPAASGIEPSSLAKPAPDDVAGRPSASGEGGPSTMAGGSSNPAGGGTNPSNQASGGVGASNSASGGVAGSADPGNGGVAGSSNSTGGGVAGSANPGNGGVAGSLNSAGGGVADSSNPGNGGVAGTSKPPSGGTANSSSNQANGSSKPPSGGTANSSSNQAGGGAGSSNPGNPANRTGAHSDGASTGDATSHPVPPHHHTTAPRPHPATPPAPHPGSGSAVSTPPGCDRSIDHDCDGIPDVR